MKLMKRFLRCEKGSVLAFVTLSMVVLVSFSAGVSDVGVIYTTRRHLQNAADSAALAGAKVLALTGAQGNAINSALDYAQRNNVPVSQIDSGYPVVTNEGPYNNNAVKVSATQHQSLLVAGLFGNGVGNINARAEAVIAPMLPTEGIWPWGVPQDQVRYGTPVALKVGSPPPNPGNFQALDFPPVGGGSNSYLNYIQTGFGEDPGESVGYPLPWYITTQTGNIAGPTRTGSDYLTGLAASSGQDDINSAWNQPNNICTWPAAPKRPSDPNVPPPASFVGDASVCYRIGIIPILRDLNVNGANQVAVVDFAAFYLIGYNNGPGGLTYFWGYFLNKALISGGRTNWGAPLTGLIGVRLWR